jgi:PAS domain S-box-containing protein
VEQKTVFRRLWVPATVVILSGALLGFTTWRAVSAGDRERAENRFSDYFSVRADLLAGRVYDIAQELNKLKSRVSDAVDRAEFARGSSEILFGDASIGAVEWAPRVTAAERSIHERQAQAEGLKAYRIRALDGSGQIVDAQPKAEYFPVRYVYPYEPNRRAVGLDLSSERDRDAALKEARESGNLVLTDALNLVQEAGVSTGFLAVLPVYAGRRTGPRSNPDGLAGFLVLVIHLETILRESMILGDAGISFQLVNDSPGRLPDVLSSSSDWDSRDPYPEGVAVRLIQIGGRHWRLMGKPSSSFVLAGKTRRPLFLAVGVLLMWGAVGTFVLLRNVRSEKIRQRKHRRTLAAVVESLSEGVVVADAAGRMTVFNNMAKRIVGLGLSDADPGQWPAEYGCFLPDTTTQFEPDRLPLARAVRGEEIRDEEMFIRNPAVPDGVWISVNGSPLIDERGARTGGVVAFRDVTERKRQDEKLLLLSNAVEQTADVVFITDRNGKIEYVNPAFEVTTGYSREEALGQSPRILKSGEHDRAYYESLWKTILAGEVFRGTSVNRKKSGDVFYAEQTITPITDSRGQVVRFVSVIKDVTESIRRREREVEMRYARQVQQRLYPDRQAQLGGLHIAGSVFPARATCGDYFDHFQMEDSSTAVAVGDVCGHGFGPAIIMAGTRAYLRGFARTSTTPSEILEATNALLHADLETGSYVTLLLVAIDTTSRRLSYANAGHTSGCLLDACGSVKASLDSGGFPLGMFPKSRYEGRESLEVQAGDLIVLSTDGVTESLAPDGSAFAAEGLLDCIRAHIHESPAEIVDSVYGAIRNRAETDAQSDDMTLVVCRVG